jgi:hypothetical protein
MAHLCPRRTFSDLCAQPGDNLVDQCVISVGKLVPPWDVMWVARVTITAIPSFRTAKTGLSTTWCATRTPSDLRQRCLSTLSTAPMTTSLRQGLPMLKAVRTVGGSAS